MALELNSEIEEWDVETLRSMVASMAAKLEISDKGELFEIKPVYCRFGRIAAAGIRSNYNNFTFSFYFSFHGGLVYGDGDVLTYGEEIFTDAVSYPIDPEEVDESMFLDFMIFLGETAEKIEG